MKAEIHKRWIEALKSGEYKKTRGNLHSKDCFCVYGVLCDLYIREHGLRWILSDTPDVWLMPSPDGADRYYPPSTVLEWAGLSHGGTMKDSILIRDDKMSLYLADVNDCLNWSFEQIADALEQQTTGTFAPEESGAKGEQ